MSDSKEKFDLPASGKATEALLRSLALPDSNVNRDALMYQAGYSAAVSELESGVANDPIVVHKSSALWPVLTAGFAATAAVCLTMLYLDDGGVEIPSDRPAVATSVETESTESSTSTLELTGSSVPKLRPMWMFPEQSYRHRISNTIRDLESRVTPASYEGSSREESDAKPLTSGSVFDAKELFKELL